jgi:RNA polymerase sigma-70 factor, ECF subfamily
MGKTQAAHNHDSGEQLPAELAGLIDTVYAELRSIAAACLRRERVNHTLQTTALVNEAYLRLARRRAWPVNDRAGFCAAAAEAIRRILTDHARRRRRLKRGGAQVCLQWDGAGVAAAEPPLDVFELDEVLKRLAGVAPRAARIVELRYFGGLSEQEVADVLGVSRRTVQCDWRWARAWLMRELS